MKPVQVRIETATMVIEVKGRDPEQVGAVVQTVLVGLREPPTGVPRPQIEHAHVAPALGGWPYPMGGLEDDDFDEDQRGWGRSARRSRRFGPRSSWSDVP